MLLYLSSLVIFFIYLYMNYKRLNSVELVFWNILAEGLALGQFITDGSDCVNVEWHIRFKKLCSEIKNQLRQGRIVCTVENDNVPAFMHYFRTECPDLDIQCEYTPKVDIRNGYKNSNLSLKVQAMRQEYDPTVEAVPNLKGKSLTEAYLKLVNAYRRENVELLHRRIQDGVDTPARFASFKDRHADKDYMEMMSKYLGMPLTEDMPYVSCDCGAIFWPNAQFNKLMKHSPDEHSIGFTSLRFQRRTMSVIEDVLCKQQPFDISTAHFTSGEGASDELERVKEMEDIMGYIKKYSLSSHVFCHDSNTSEDYTCDMKKGIVKKNEKVVGELTKFFVDVVDQHGWKNHIDETKETICFKMRGGSTSCSAKQRKKYGKLMADRIDRIATPKNQVCKMISLGQSPLTDDEFKLIKTWRRTEEYRDLIKIACTDEEQSWGQDAGKIVFSDKLLNALRVDRNLSDEAIINIFKKLFPSRYMASDHQMVAVQMEL